MGMRTAIQEIEVERENYRVRKAIEDERHSCLCRRSGESTEGCPWKCPTWAGEADHAE